MKEVPIEKGTGQSDFKIAANCDKKKSSNSCHCRIVVFFFFFFFLAVVRTALHKEKNNS